MNYPSAKKVHIIGIEGGGTSALACLYHNMGLAVSGSDNGDHFFKSLLEGKGITLFPDFSAANLPADADFFVYSTAFKPETNPELAQALTSGKPVLSYPEALADLFNQRWGIAVCGSHGKTTTSAWLAWVMVQAGVSLDFVIGAKVPQLNDFNNLQPARYFLIEADEYQNKLRYYQPRMILLNNIDYDHPDFFPSPAVYEQAFADFLAKLPADGFLIVNSDQETANRLAATNGRGHLITYSLTDNTADYWASNLQTNELGQNFTVHSQAEDLGEFSIKLWGEHNISNALAVIAASLALKIPVAEIKKHLASFTGTVRRLQELGHFQGAIILDDFAHHPTEIKATLAAVKQKYPKQTLRVVFHPHTFTRTKALLEDFINSLSGMDELIILDIYGSAREQQGGINSQDLVSQLQTAYPEQQTKYIPDLAAATDYLRSSLQDGEVLLLMGAGDVFQIGLKLLGK